MTTIESPFDTIIIGAGIAGLSCAYWEKKRGASILVLEKSQRAGGVIRSSQQDGYLLEFGPNTVQMKPEIFELISSLGLKAELQIADSRISRYIQYGGKLHPVPMSPLSLMGTGLLSFRAKLRLLQEPFKPAKKNPSDETLSAFVKRRLGNEVAERLVAPFASGVWAGDTDELSAASTFPKPAEWEKNHGSLFKGALSNVFGSREKKSSPRGLFSFKRGLETLPNALARHLDGHIHLGISPTALEQTPKGEWVVKTPGFPVQARHVVLTVPAWEAARLVRPFAPDASATLNNIPYAPLAVLHMGYDRKAVRNPMQGFGFLVAPEEKSEILGCLWNSSLFPDRAPAGKALITVFMGGAKKRNLPALPDATLVNAAIKSVEKPLGAKGEPVFIRVTRYERAIPQYVLGHEERIRLLARTEAQHPGLFFRGNYRGGISVGDVIKNQFQNSF